jgi:hypothetical protein
VLNGKDNPWSERPHVRRPQFAELSQTSLVLVLDAVSWDVAHQLWEEGYLPGFCEPVPSVSVFPSFTNVAVPALIHPILGARPLGYEARYYHPPSATIRGGPDDPEAARPMARYRSCPQGARDLLAAFCFPQLMIWREVGLLLDRVVNQRGGWLAYASATDCVAHFAGREALLAVLRKIARQIISARDAIEQEEGTAPPVVLTSDHGMAFGPLAYVSCAAVRETLEAGGFVARGSGPDGFFLPAMGDIAAGVCFVTPERAVIAARLLTEIEAIELVVARRDDESAIVLRGTEKAIIDWRKGRYRYHATCGDPLRYGSIWAALERNGEMDANGLVDGDVLLAATWSHDYPDALHRIRRAITDLVEFPAPVLFSMGSGYTYGPALTHAGSTLLGGQVGTHGGLGLEQSLGFLSVAGLPAPPPVVRAESALIPYSDLVIRGANGD